MNRKITIEYKYSSEFDTTPYEEDMHDHAMSIINGMMEMGYIGGEMYYHEPNNEVEIRGSWSVKIDDI